MNETQIRPANSSDVAAIKALVEDAYAHYVERLGRRPAPMTTDYSQLVQNGNVWCLVLGEDLCGLVVLRKEVDHILVSNIAVAKNRQGQGFGRQLLDYADLVARSDNIEELRLYTNELIHENLSFYARLGWEEYDRAEKDGYRRVFMRKRLLLSP